VCSRAVHVFFLDHWFASKSFTAVNEAFSSVCANNGIQNTTIIHRLVTQFRDSWRVYDRKEVHRRKLLMGKLLRSVEETKRNTTQLFYCRSSFASTSLGVTLSQWSPYLTLPNFFPQGFLKGRAYSNNSGRSEEQRRNIYWTDCCQHWPRNISQSHSNHTERGECLSSRRWWKFSSSAVKLFCKLFLTSRLKINFFSSYIYASRAYKLCCCYGCILNGTLCTFPTQCLIKRERHTWLSEKKRKNVGYLTNCIKNGSKSDKK
jgi:hypothetical protein